MVRPVEPAGCFRSRPQVGVLCALTAVAWRRGAVVSWHRPFIIHASNVRIYPDKCGWPDFKDVPLVCTQPHQRDIFGLRPAGRAGGGRAP